MPPDGLAGEDEPKFATLPFHLSFQRLLELIQGAMGNGEELTAALARLQDGDHAGMDRITDAVGTLASEQMMTLEALLGHKFSVNSAGDTDFESLLRDRAEVLGAAAFGSEGLSSGMLAKSGAGGSETLASELLGKAPTGREALSSGLLAQGAGGSEKLSSAGLIGPVGGMGSETLSSGAFGRGSPSGHLRPG